MNNVLEIATKMNMILYFVRIMDIGCKESNMMVIRKLVDCLKQKYMLE